MFCNKQCIFAFDDKYLCFATYDNIFLDWIRYCSDFCQVSLATVIKKQILWQIIDINIYNQLFKHYSRKKLFKQDFQYIPLNIVILAKRKFFQKIENIQAKFTYIFFRFQQKICIKYLIKKSQKKIDIIMNFQDFDQNILFKNKKLIL